MRLPARFSHLFQLVRHCPNTGPNVLAQPRVSTLVHRNIVFLFPRKRFGWVYSSYSKDCVNRGLDCHMVGACENRHSTYLVLRPPVRSLCSRQLIRTSLLTLTIIGHRTVVNRVSHCMLALVHVRQGAGKGPCTSQVEDLHNADQSSKSPPSNS